MAEMVRLAASVTPVVCATTLEAEVRELRLIAAHKPPYNRRSKSPERATWVKLTVEAFPRLSIVREVRKDGASYIGPFGSRASAEDAVAAVHEVIPLRQCVQRLSPTTRVGACMLADMGRCGAPCTGAQSVEEYAEVARDAVTALSGDSRRVVTALRTRMVTLSEQQRFEDAGALRDRLLALVRGMARVQRLAPLAASPEIMAARPAVTGGWELICVRHGRLAATTVSPRGADPMPYVKALRDSAEVVLPAPWPAPAATAEETEKVLRWLEQPGVRIVDVQGEWTCPVGGAGSARAQLEPQAVSRHEAAGFVAAS
jgi:DNA polymerase-3 subunit epsilon